MKVNDVKELIWKLDASLSVFQGVEWLQNVGRVARLKEDYFRCRSADSCALGLMSVSDEECLCRCFAIFAEADVSDRQRSVAFDTAVKIIGALLPDVRGRAA